ncbi:MAG: ornithine carbamoyltransferase [Acidimicrobiia bacterium]|nr:ornithine carbamoyltransferase [Acidimicrobiia bacterium]
MSTDLLDLTALAPADCATILTAATAWKSDPSLVPQVLNGTGAAAIFTKPSLRTRMSFESAVASLGGHPISFSGPEVGLGGRETASDIARTVASTLSVLAARVHNHGDLIEMADAVDIPVINLLSDESHPLQALADLLTCVENWGALSGRKLAYVGDGNNVAVSLARACALTGMTMSCASPEGYAISPVIIDEVNARGQVLEQLTDPVAAVTGADAVYTDVWTSMGQEDESQQRLAAFEGFTVTSALLAHAKPDAIFLHCLPAHRGEEVSAEVIDGPQSRVWQQAGNRFHAARAAIAWCLDPSELLT